MDDINPEFKQALLDTIEQIEENDYNTPVVFRWSFNEKPDWQIALGFKKVDEKGLSLQ